MKYILKLGLLTLLVSCKQSQTEKPQEVEQAEVETKTEVVMKKEPLLAPKMNLGNPSLKYHSGRSAAIYGEGVLISFTIKNESEIGIKKVYLNGNFKYKGRTISHNENINYEFRKGLEPDETQKVSLHPNALSKWNDKIRPGDQGDFTLEVLAVEDYNGNKKK